ncbi:MAG: SAM-dependent methyltransferase, partial [Deltaproteobacteria bacterium]|nr:SAM-dependent methyltransferase [Deltaproteobacteria bacterium]
IQTSKGNFLSFTYKYSTKDITKNFSIEEGLQIIITLLTDFTDATLFSTNENIELKIFKKKTHLKHLKPTIKTKPLLSHDRRKKRIIKTQNNIYLKELGVISSKFKILSNKNDKYRQINKFIEIFDSLLSERVSPKTLSVIDMGSGKGYLTFSVYDYLVNIKKIKASVIGIESRIELVALCNKIAEKANFQNLSFKQGTISNYKTEGIDILIALHACDTATDESIFQGISKNAQLIICAPCCHKQIRKQFHVRNELKSILKYGILEERQAELITDGIRALIMEFFGYKTKVFEFISNEHTAKNIMITGIKTREQVNKERILQEINAIKKIYGIKKHHLEILLNVT